MPPPITRISSTRLTPDLASFYDAIPWLRFILFLLFLLPSFLTPFFLSSRSLTLFWMRSCGFLFFSSSEPYVRSMNKYIFTNPFCSAMIIFLYAFFFFSEAKFCKKSFQVIIYYEAFYRWVWFPSAGLRCFCHALFPTLLLLSDVL